MIRQSLRRDREMGLRISRLRDLRKVRTGRNDAEFAAYEIAGIQRHMVVQHEVKGGSRRSGALAVIPQVAVALVIERLHPGNRVRCKC